MSHTMLMVKILNTHPAKVHKNAMIYFPLYIHSKYATYSLSKFTILIIIIIFLSANAAWGFFMIMHRLLISQDKN